MPSLAYFSLYELKFRIWNIQILSSIFLIYKLLLAKCFTEQQTTTNQWHKTIINEKKSLIKTDLWNTTDGDTLTSVRLFQSLAASVISVYKLKILNNEKTSNPKRTWLCFEVFPFILTQSVCNLWHFTVHAALAPVLFSSSSFLSLAWLLLK